MTAILTVLAEGFADWETALLNAAARGYYSIDTHYATPGGKPVTSAGGLMVTPDLSIEDCDGSDFAAVIVCGGSIWTSEAAPDLGPLLKGARASGGIVAAICDGTIGAARTGVLDDVAHTSNGPGYLDATGYAGKAGYRDVPHAVISGNIITAPGTAPVSFAAAVLRGLGQGSPDLDYYIGLYGAEHQKG